MNNDGLPGFWVCDPKGRVRAAFGVRAQATTWIAKYAKRPELRVTYHDAALATECKRLRYVVTVSDADGFVALFAVKREAERWAKRVFGDDAMVASKTIADEPKKNRSKVKPAADNGYTPVDFDAVAAAARKHLPTDKLLLPNDEQMHALLSSFRRVLDMMFEACNVVFESFRKAMNDPTRGPKFKALFDTLNGKPAKKARRR